MELSIDFVKQLKQHILASRYLVAKMANAESLRLYFAIGQDLDTEIKHNAWGDKILDSVVGAFTARTAWIKRLFGVKI
ncbi:MAG: hypothetical protein IPK21_15315 [Haliscomenobacter sp.]|nr:hypothetical protein [Haliscomenobacter sp.]